MARHASVGNMIAATMSDSDHKAGTAVISVGGFLGMGSKLVSVPVDLHRIENDRIIMPGATKASLEGMAAYRYTNV
jgi:PRC-barrel domain